MKKASQLIADRKKLDTDLNYFWNIIYTENIVYKNQKRGFNLKYIFETKIKELSNQRINTKLLITALNNGWYDPSKVNADWMDPLIFKLSELNEIYVRLGKIKTLDPKLKSKLGKKKMNKTEIFTKQYIDMKRSELIIQINAIRKKLDELNSEREIDDSKPFIFMTADTTSSIITSIAA